MFAQTYIEKTAAQFLCGSFFARFTAAMCLRAQLLCHLTQQGLQPCLKHFGSAAVYFKRTTRIVYK
jgi:hypothetical protein